MKIKRLPYSERYKKKPLMKIKGGKNSDYIGVKNKMENRLLDYKSESIYTPSDFNETGRVWTF